MVNTNKPITLFELMGGDNIEKAWNRGGYTTTPELFLKLDTLRLNNIYKCIGYGKFFGEGDYYLLNDNIVFNESNSFSKLVKIFVPKEGKAPTLLGEMLRALNYIKTRLQFGSELEDVASSLWFITDTTHNIFLDHYFNDMFDTIIEDNILPKGKLSLVKVMNCMKENPNKLNYYLNYLEYSFNKIMTSNLCYYFLKREVNSDPKYYEIPLTKLKDTLRFYSQENKVDSRTYHKY